MAQFKTDRVGGRRMRRRSQGNPDELRLVSRFKGEGRQKIHSDGEKARSRLKPYFETLERLIFEAGLTVADVCKEAGISQYNLGYNEFRTITGMTPKDYIDHHKVMTAQMILQYTDIVLYQVSNTVGFSTQAVFSRIYKAELGYLPSEEARRDCIELVDSSNVASPTLDPRTCANTAELRSSSLELAGFWDAIRDMNRLEIKTFLRQNLEQLEIKHFYFLVDKAKYEGRLDRKRGEELHRTAIDLIRAVEFWRGGSRDEEKCLGYAMLANACKLRFNLEDAAKYFRRADTYLPTDPEENPKLFARVNFLRVSLLWWQRNVEGALDLFHTVIPIMREYGSHEELARLLILGGEIFDSTGRPERAMPLLSEAIGLTRYVDDTYVVFTTHFNLTIVYTKMEMVAEAVSELAVVQESLDQVRGHVSVYYVSYLEGLVLKLSGKEEEALSLFLESKAGFLDQGLDIYSALVSLDEALLRASIDDLEGAFDVAVSAIPLVSRFSYHREAISALTILQEVEERASIDAAMIRRALNHLDLARKDPTVNFMREET